LKERKDDDGVSHWRKNNCQVSNSSGTTITATPPRNNSGTKVIIIVQSPNTIRHPSFGPMLWR